MTSYIITARLTPQGLHAFFDDDRDHDERRDGVGPPEAEERVQEEAAEQEGLSDAWRVVGAPERG